MKTIAKKKLTGVECMLSAITAFGGLGLEVLLAYVLEPMIFGVPGQEYSTTQRIIHWIVTCVLWAAMALWILHDSKKNCDYRPLTKGTAMKPWQWAVVVIEVLCATVLVSLDWGGLKIILEFQKKGILLFTFQYIYYAFEIILVLLIIVYGQRAGELWFHKEKIPFGGIFCGLTWGMVHILTKGDLSAGFALFTLSLLMGSAYLLTNKDAKKSYVVLLLMFCL